MPLDGLSLHVVKNELDASLRNGRVLKIYQPDETTITLHLRLPGKTEVLLISVDALYPRVHTIKEQPTNPLNPPAFCMLLRKYLEPSRLLAISQEGFDRILHLRFEGVDTSGQLMEATLVFELMGRQSNLYLVNEEGILLDALKRFPDKGVMPGKPYLPPSDQGKMEPGELSPDAFEDQIRLLPAPAPVWKWIADTFQGFSKVAPREVVRRAGFDPGTKRSSLQAEDWMKIHDAFADLIKEIEEGGTPTLYVEMRDFAAYTLTGAQGERFESTNQLIREVLGEKQRDKTLDEFKSSLKKRLSRHRKRVEKKQALQETALQEAEHAEAYRHQGELLTASFHLIKPGVSSCEVPDYTQEDAPLVTITLDPRLSPSANVQRIFKRYAKAKASQKHTNQQLQKTKSERRYLEDVLLQIDLADSVRILKEIEGELQSSGYLKRREKAHPAAKKAKVIAGPERYLSEDGLTILVGRNNVQNDQLTFGFTGPNHIWLHAKNIPGSHVSILSEGEIPQGTLLQAAELAAYFSQSRHSPKVEVDYTLRKHVRKPRGAKPGFVHYDGAKTLLVNPTDFVWPQKQT